MTQITFTSIINTALLKANNRDNLKSYLIRQSKIANRDAFYELEDFSKELIKVATGKIGYIKHSHDVYLKHVQTQIDNIETLSFKDPSRVKDLTDYTNEERAQFQETERAKYLKWAKHELKNSKLNDYNKNEYGRLETIIDVVNEINNNNNNVITDNPDWNFTALQWSAIFYYVEPDLYGNIEQKKNRLQAFITDFKVNKKPNSLSNKHSEIVRVVTDDEKNELKQIHISAIEKILPFLKDNYPNAFTDADQDFKRLADNLDRK